MRHPKLNHKTLFLHTQEVAHFNTFHVQKDGILGTVHDFSLAMTHDCKLVSSRNCCICLTLLFLIPTIWSWSLRIPSWHKSSYDSQAMDLCFGSIAFLLNVLFLFYSFDLCVVHTVTSIGLLWIYLYCPLNDIVLLFHAKAWETGPVSFGGLRSLARIFSSSLAKTESSEFTRLLLYLPPKWPFETF